MCLLFMGQRFHTWLETRSASLPVQSNFCHEADQQNQEESENQRTVASRARSASNEIRYRYRQRGAAAPSLFSLLGISTHTTLQTTGTPCDYITDTASISPDCHHRSMGPFRNACNTDWLFALSGNCTNTSGQHILPPASTLP